jgi:CDP-diacylglycerol--glycerol-3-phosphate 3-phosphatidyltransferase
MKLNVPMAITFLRILLIPIFVIVFYLPFGWSHFASAIVFALASATDWLDGYLARKLSQTTAFGAFLDPVADKLMVVVALVLLVGNPYLLYIAIPAAIIVGRECAISALREWMAEIGRRVSVAVTYVSKFKTAAQMLAIIALLAGNPKHPGILIYSGYILLYIAAILTIWTMVVYIKIAWPSFELQ